MKQKWVKRIARAILPCFVFFVFSFSFAPKAYAAESNVSVTYGFYYGLSNNASFSQTKSASGTTPITNSQLTVGRFASADPYAKVRPFVITSGTTWHSGIAKLYCSFVFIGAGFVNNVDYSDPDFWVSYYDNSNGVRVETPGAYSASQFSTTTGIGTGYSLEFKFVGSEGLPITRLAFNALPNTGYANTTREAFGYYFPSIRVISTENSAEMESLENISNAIIGQNDLLLAMKGDIVAILQDIYQNTGDIETAANLMNSYLSTMVTHLNNIKNNTANINTKLGSIYTYMGTMLSALETAISLNADTIEAAIAAQTAAMIAYFEQYFNTGNEVPDDTYQQQQDAVNILDQMESLEKPNVDTIVPEIGDYTDSGVSGVLSAIFSSNLIVTMMTLSASFAFGAYVLFGKRE